MLIKSLEKEKLMEIALEYALSDEIVAVNLMEKSGTGIT
jgi:hypothetical protein